MEAKTTEEYIDMFEGKKREILQKVRAVIKQNAPDAMEKISWKMPTFFQSENLIQFALATNHLGIYPSPSGIQAFKEDFDKLGLKYSKGAVQFKLSEVIPYDLIGAMAKYRVGEIEKCQK